LPGAPIRLARLRVGGQRDAVAVSVGQAVGLTLRHQIMPGQAVPMADLVPPTLVARGGLVLMQLDSPGIALTAEGMAMESGALGAHVRVLNPISRAVVEADVIGPGQVRVDPNSLPVGLPAHGPAVAQVLR
jgi:flagella basal body P-ring formation protein FlgA